MHPDDAFLLSLAGSVSDMDKIDWERVSREADTGEARELVRGLQAIAGVAETHRRSFLEATGRLEDEDMRATLDARRCPPSGLPRRWGHLQLIEALGHGSFGDVYRAWDTTLDRDVAVKLYRTPQPAEPEGSLLTEGRLLARVRHPNVVAVYGAEQHDGTTGLWMELIRGRSLATLVETQGAFGAREATLIGLDLCRALAATHRVGLVHGDLKAANVMREEGGRLVLMDFGAGRNSLAGGGEGRVSGTPLYMAPELFSGAGISIRSDIYSLGVLLHYLVSMRFPVLGATLDELGDAHRLGRRRLLRDERPDLPEAFLGIAERATAARPEDRFESAGAMEAALVQSLGLSAPERAPVILSQPLAAGWRSALAAAAAIAVVASAAALWAPWRTQPVVDAPATPAPLLPSTSSSVGEPLRAPVVTTPAPVAEARAGVSVPPASHRPEPAVQDPVPATVPAAATKTEPAAPPTEVRALATSAYTVEASFYRSLGDTAEPLLPGALVSLGDQLYLEFEASMPVHLYVVNEDEQGAAFLLFPLPGQEARNPLPAGERLRLPGTREGKPVFWQVTSQGAREHFLLVASPERLVQLEADLLSLERAEIGRPLLAAPLGPAVMSRLRGVGGIATGAAPEAGRSGRVAELARQLTARTETVRGVWVRKFELENPAR